MKDNEFRTHTTCMSSLKAKQPPHGSTITMKWSSQSEMWQARLVTDDNHIGWTSISGSPFEALYLMLEMIENRPNQ